MFSYLISNWLFITNSIKVQIFGVLSVQLLVVMFSADILMLLIDTFMLVFLVFLRGF